MLIGVRAGERLVAGAGAPPLAPRPVTLINMHHETIYEPADDIDFIKS